MSATAYASWGRYPKAQARQIVRLRSTDDPPDLSRLETPLLSHGCGRSYGDVCLNDGGTLLDTLGLARVLRFDEATGEVECETGVTLAALIHRFLPRGWLPPVLPGTQWVTVGGAIANDIHGKNHHLAGSFGRGIRSIRLLRSDGSLETTSGPDAPLQRATVGGLGLTGLMLSATIQLRRVPSAWMRVERQSFATLEEWLALSSEWDRTHEYTVAWVDCLARGPVLGRGILFGGDHADRAGPPARERRRLRVPLDAPGWLLNRFAVRVFNALYYRRHRRSQPVELLPLERFFFPLDAIADWNRLYGRRGLLQYQCVVPADSAPGVLRELLHTVARSGRASLLAVLKRFGDLPQPGLLSFSRPGVTLAMDFPFEGPATMTLLDELDRITLSGGGAIYPAKDARMSPATFERSFPTLEEFRRLKDPAFSSSFWRRVAETPANAGS